MTDLTRTDLKFKRYWLKNPESDKSKIEIKPPQICPICGLPPTNENYKINSKFKFPSNSFKIGICNNHFGLKLESARAKTILYLFAFSLLLFALLLLISDYYNYILLRSTSFIVVVTLCSSLCAYNIFEDFKETHIIRQYIFIESFKEGCVVSVKNPEWAEEFKKINQCTEIKIEPKEQLRACEKIEFKIYRIQLVLTGLAIISFIGFLICLYYRNFFIIIDLVLIETIRRILNGISSILMFILVFNYLYFVNYKIKNEKYKIYMKSLKK
ncbi:MAG: hypothetical protein ACFFAN_11630 [Promethearchaeota archaeon]